MNHRPRLIALADEIRSRRLAAALTREELALKADLSFATIKLLERPAGRDWCSAKTIRKLAKALGCQPSDISRVETVEVAS